MDSSDWRVIQVFLSNRVPSIAEVEVNMETQEIRCTCPAFAGRNQCKHTKFVTARIKNNDGTYPLMVVDSTTEQEAMDAQESAETFRDFIIRRSKIEVL